MATAAKVVLLLLLKVRGASSLLVSLRIDSYASKVKISKLFQFHTVPARRKTKGNIISTLHPQIFLEKSALKPDFEAPFIPPLIPLSFNLLQLESLHIYKRRFVRGVMRNHSSETSSLRVQCKLEVSEVVRCYPSLSGTNHFQ